MPSLKHRRQQPLHRCILAAVLAGLMPIQGFAVDILRPHRGQNSSGSGATTAQEGLDSRVGAAAAQAARVNAGNALARTAQAMQAVRNLQAQARAQIAANRPNPNAPGTSLPTVPDGLGEGGLDLIGSAVGADAPTQSSANGRTTVSIRQNLQQAFLNWRSFNVGRNTTLQFDQSQGGRDVGQWIAFNKVSDPSLRPSQILGQIKAPGQVYVINPNGIIFGSGSEVNTHTLVASSLPLNSNLTQSGLLNNPDLQPLFSALEVAAGAKGTAAFTPELNAGNKIGDIKVEAGAQISAPTSADKVGGRVLLAGANVIQEGSIDTPDGQTILAAGLQLGVMGHRSDDPSLRGLDVYVGAVEDGRVSGWAGSVGSVRNSGIISAARGNITLAGKALENQGILHATTSVSFNGRIDLQAAYGSISNPIYDPTNAAYGLPFLASTSGSITLGPSSLTQVLPEWDSRERVVGSQLALSSQINLRGAWIRLADQATLLAPSGVVNMEAGQWKIDLAGGTPRGQFAYTDGQIHVGQGALISVAGSAAVEASVLENILSLQLRGSEFADFSYNRNGDLRGVDLLVDIRRQGVFDGRAWIGTPIADASGFVGLIERDVARLTIDGGILNLRAGDSLILQRDAVLDVSGGYLDYAGASVTTSRVLYQGRLIDIADATPDRVYSGLYRGSFSVINSQWGVRDTYINPLHRGTRYEAGYLFGGAGGKLLLQAPSMALDATTRGAVVNGERQLSLQADASQLSLNLSNQRDVGPQYLAQSPYSARILFQGSSSLPAAPQFALDALGKPMGLSSEHRQSIVLSPQSLRQAGFGRLAINNREGEVSLASGQTLDLGVHGALEVDAANIHIEGTIQSAGGRIALRAYNLSPYLADQVRQSADPYTLTANSDRGLISVGAQGAILTRGDLIDERLGSHLSPYRLEGGEVLLKGWEIRLQEGSLIDVSGGAQMAASGSVRYGAAGAITLKSGADLSMSWVLGGGMTLGGSLRGIAGVQALGGSLVLQAPRLAVSNDPVAGALSLTPDFFSRGGFASHSLSAVGSQGSDDSADLVINDGVMLRPEVRSYLYTPGDVGGPMREILPPAGLRQPYHLSLGAQGATDEFTRLLIERGDLLIRSTAEVNAGALGNINLQADTLDVRGSLIASGGSINLKAADRLPSLDPNPPSAFVTVYLAQTARLDVAGSFLATPDPFGRELGRLLNGGSIRVSGNLVAEQGAVLDASGISRRMEILPAELGLNPQGQSLNLGMSSLPTSGGISATANAQASIITTLQSDGGGIVLHGGQMLHSNATLRAAAGGQEAEGGSLEVSSGRFYPSGITPEPDDLNLSISQSASSGPFFNNPAQAIGNAPAQPSGRGYFAAEAFVGGGFDHLKLGGNVSFEGEVSLQAVGSMSVASGGVLQADASVRLQAAHVALGKVFEGPLSPLDVANPFLQDVQPFFFAPTSGGGSLEVIARHVDVGNLSLQGIGNATLSALGGDLRGQGSLNMAGHLTLNATQIYPLSGSSFALSVFDPSATEQGSITVQGNGQRRLPLSAGGTLALYASAIRSDGVLRAPLGQILLGWNGEGQRPVDLIAGDKAQIPVTQRLELGAGSLTSVSAMDGNRAMIMPLGVSSDGRSWIHPNGVDITKNGPTTKLINLSAQSVSMEWGATTDLRGGGNLMAYRFVSGLNGTRDLLASEQLFAVLPGYDSEIAPWGLFNRGAQATLLRGDQGYDNPRIQVGDRITLGAGSGLRAGTYTLLPARYALLPGAFLITPQSEIPVSAQLLPDGASLTSGSIYNGLNSNRSAPRLRQSFEIASAGTLAQRARYDLLGGNEFFADIATSRGEAVPRLPQDSGRMMLAATQSMAMLGSITAKPNSTAGRDGMLDISSPLDILIGHTDSIASSGQMLLISSTLTQSGVGSLLIGGARSSDSSEAQVSVKTGQIVLDNFNPYTGTAEALGGPEIILVANQRIEIRSDALLNQQGALSGNSQRLTLGSSDASGSGSGALIRISSDAQASIQRQSVTAGTGPARLQVAANATLHGNSIILDSTNQFLLDPSATLTGNHLTLSSGAIELIVDETLNPAASSALRLGPAALNALGQAKSLALLSYSRMDTYGAGQIGSEQLQSLRLGAADIRGMNLSSGSLTFSAKTIQIGNPNNGAPISGSGPTSAGNLIFEAQRLEMASNDLRLSRFNAVEMSLSQELLFSGTGLLTVSSGLQIDAPQLRALSATQNGIVSGGHLQINGGNAQAQASGLGVSLSLAGASLTYDGAMTLPGGQLSLIANAGNLSIGGRINLDGIQAGTSTQSKRIDGGQLLLRAAQGNLVASGSISLRAPEGATGGLLDLQTPAGSMNLAEATILADHAASLRMDVQQLPEILSLNQELGPEAFTGDRTLRVRQGNVLINGETRVSNFSLSADNGSILVSGLIEVSGHSAGDIRLMAAGSLTLQAGSQLLATSMQTRANGRSGSIALETSGRLGGEINIASGSLMDLRLSAPTALGQYSGTLHLRAPQNAVGNDLLIRPLAGSVIGAALITAEGYRTTELAGAGHISNSVRVQAQADASSFMSHEAAISSRLLSGGSGLAANDLLIVPGIEIINRGGDLQLGSPLAGPTSSAWDLSSQRFGSRMSPGVLTLRASGNLTFYESLSDGFSSAAYNAGLLTNNALLPDLAESWSYHLSAGSDFTSVNRASVVGAVGSLMLGRNAGDANEIASNLGNNARTSVAIQGFHQVIRTGSGSIDIQTGADINLLNLFAGIYTAGTQVSDPTLGGQFDLPVISFAGGSNSLGPIQQTPAHSPQYSLSGGDVRIEAGRDIQRLTRNAADELVPDSSRQLPMNWLYRRGYVDPMTGAFASARFGDLATTTWWVDFSNFFQGVGALGGGDVTLSAGRDLRNVDAVIPTNARLDRSGNLVELGGGNLRLTSGRHLDAGVFYVERGQAKARVGGAVLSNATRSPSLTNLADAGPLAAETWLPTTFFVGKASVELTARSSILIAPASNPFLLPGGYNNSFWYKSYFNTYAETALLDATSITGSITLRAATTLPTIGGGGAIPILQAWLQTQLVYNFQNPGTASYYHPWLRLNETKVDSFGTVSQLTSPSLALQALGGDLNLVGSIILSPSPQGRLNLFAEGSINALQPNGRTSLNAQSVAAWGSSRITVSDADPRNIPGISNPFAFQSIAGLSSSRASVSGDNFLLFLEANLRETGSTIGAAAVLQARQALHAPGLLHLNHDQPLQIRANTGDLSGLELFSAHFSQISAGRDIRDVSLYLQNNRSTDLSVVSSGRDILLYDANSALRTQAQSGANLLNVGADPLGGDLQISGPGQLQVLAGRHLDLGLGGNNSDGTGAGITSIGNGRNPGLPFQGADLILAAGIGAAGSIGNSRLTIEDFVTDILQGSRAEEYLRLYASKSNSNVDTAAEFNALDPVERQKACLDLFAIVLRTAGREQAAKGGSYADGFAAIESLFPGQDWQGNISTQARDIRSRSGGSIDILAPGGGLTLASALLGTSLAPPGIITEGGGGINIFARNDIDIGIARIFTLRGGDEILWSSFGNIAAGSSSKTVQSAPPTRVLIDPQSADVKTDLAGLATGGGIGVLASVAGIAPGNVDLIAPNGTVDAGDAGIRATGNLNIAASVVLNSNNISVGGTASGSAAAPSAPAISVSSVANSSNAAAAAGNASAARPSGGKEQQSVAAQTEGGISLMSVEVLGYGGGEGEAEEDERKRKAPGT